MGLAVAIEKFGVMAIMGRPTLTAGEVIKMQHVSGMMKAHAVLKASGDFTAWAKKYPYWAKVFTEIASE